MRLTCGGARSVIKSSRASGKKDSQLTKAVKQRNKAQRTNKVAAARGMDIDKVPVPMARKGAKTLSSKKNIKIKGKVAPAKGGKAVAKGGKASQGKLTLAAMLQKPLSNASQNSTKGGRGATPTKAGGRKGAAQVQVTIKNAGARGGGGRGGGRGGGVEGGEGGSGGLLGLLK